MKSTNLRNKPVDRRRLSAKDKESYRPTARAQALSRARQRRGQLSWESKVTRGTQEQKPGTGGFTSGLVMQQQRNREKGAEVKRSKQLRAEKPIY